MPNEEAGHPVETTKSDSQIPPPPPSPPATQLSELGAPNEPARTVASEETTTENENVVQPKKNPMAPSEKWMIVLTAIIAIATAINVLIFYLESESTGKQIDKLTEKAGGIVDSMNHALSENRDSIAKAFDANERHSQSALNASIAASRALAAEAKRSADIAQSQQAPWVGIEQASLITALPNYIWSPPLPDPTMWVETGFSIKNYGAAPAFLEHEHTSLAPVPDRGVELPSLKKACLIDAYRTPGQVTLQGDIGEMILPGGTKVSGVGQNMTHDMQTTKELKRIWITICILYRDPQTNWHYSGYRYITTGGATTPVTFLNHPGWSYQPFTRASLIAASAE